jgi:UDP-glucose 4-epimerase
VNDKSVLLTGGAGFLGSHVARLLLESGNRVTVLDDFSNGKEMHLEPLRSNALLDVVRGDVRDTALVDGLVADSDIIIHLAVLDLRQSIIDPRYVASVIGDGTLNCLDAARKHGIELFLNCSSSEVFGGAREIPMSEEHPLNPETPYAAAKVAQDMYVASYGRTYDLTWATIRPFNMYGPHSHWQGFRGELIPKMIVRAMNRQPLVIFGDGSQTRDFLYVEEAAKAVIAVADNPECRGQSINFCSGVETSVKRIAQILCEYFELDPETYIEHQPARPGDVSRHLGDVSRFVSLVGFRPSVTIEEGIARTIEWFRSLSDAPEELLAAEVLRNWE